MFTVQFGIFFIFLLSSFNKSQAKGSLKVNNRTVVALAGHSVFLYITVTVPGNTTGTSVFCFRNHQQVWKHDFNKFPSATNVLVEAKITMHDSSASGEYYFQYQLEKSFWVALVRDVGYLEPEEPLDSEVIAMLTVTLILFLFSIIGSVCICKWHKVTLKAHHSSEGGEDGEKSRKSKMANSNVGVISQGPNSESVYMPLEPRPVSIYDVLNVDEERRESSEKRITEQTAKTSQAEEGIFESVYENL